MPSFGRERSGIGSASCTGAPPVISPTAPVRSLLTALGFIAEAPSYKPKEPGEAARKTAARDATGAGPEPPEQCHRQRTACDLRQTWLQPT